MIKTNVLTVSNYHSNATSSRSPLLGTLLSLFCSLKQRHLRAVLSITVLSNTSNTTPYDDTPQTKRQAGREEVQGSEVLIPIHTHSKPLKMDKRKMTIAD
jgi:hypothetical protein